MFKWLLFIGGGTVLIYSMIYGKNATLQILAFKFHLPDTHEVSEHYKNIKLEKENAKLIAELNNLRFTLDRAQEQGLIKDERYTLSRTMASGQKQFEILNDHVKDYVQQDIYQWSEIKLHSLFQREYTLKNFMAASQYGLTFLNNHLNSNLVNDYFLFLVGISCVQSGYYLHQSVQVFAILLEKFPNSAYIVKTKLWRGLAYYQLKDQRSFNDMIEEFKEKYRNTKEWDILKNIYERNLASETHEQNNNQNENDHSNSAENSTPSIHANDNNSSNTLKKYQHQLSELKHLFRSHQANHDQANHDQASSHDATPDVVKDLTEDSTKLPDIPEAPPEEKHGPENHGGSEHGGGGHGTSAPAHH